MWFTSRVLWLRPWLSEFYCLLRKPRAVTRLLLVCQFEELLDVLSSDLAVAADMKDCDILTGWKLHFVAGTVVRSKYCAATAGPRVRNCCVSVVLYAFDDASTTTTSRSTFAADFFFHAIRVQAPIPLRVRSAASWTGAADAFATQHVAGVGWWLPSGLPSRP